MCQDAFSRLAEIARDMPTLGLVTASEERASSQRSGRRRSTLGGQHLASRGFMSFRGTVRQLAVG
jgi:hypothetical protein